MCNIFCFTSPGTIHFLLPGHLVCAQMSAGRRETLRIKHGPHCLSALLTGSRDQLKIPAASVITVFGSSFLFFSLSRALTSSEQICLMMFWTSVTCTILAEFCVFLSLTFLTIGCYFFKTIYFIIYHFFGKTVFIDSLKIMDQMNKKWIHIFLWYKFILVYFKRNDAGNVALTEYETVFAL